MGLSMKESLITDVKGDLETRIDNLKYFLEKDETKEDYSLLLELLECSYILAKYVYELDLDDKETEKYLCDIATITDESKYYLNLMGTLKSCTSE